MVDEGFCFAGAFGHAEGVGQEFFDQEEVRGGGEGAVEGEDGPRALEAVAGEVEFRHRVDCGGEGPVRIGDEAGGGGGRDGRFWRCSFMVGPLGALLIQM